MQFGAASTGINIIVSVHTTIETFGGRYELDGVCECFVFQLEWNVSVSSEEYLHGLSFVCRKIKSDGVQ